MGSMTDYMQDLEAERFDEWLEENYPDVVPDSEEWEQAANLYYWEQEALADQAQWDHEHGLFVASLNNIQQRFLAPCFFHYIKYWLILLSLRTDRAPVNLLHIFNNTIGKADIQE